MLDKNDPKTWRDTVKVGDILTLTDEQTLADLMDEKAANALRGLDLTIVEKERIKQQDGDFEFIWFELEGYKSEGRDVPLWLAVKIAKGARDLDLRIYFQPDDFEAGGREDVIDAGNHWLFEPPEDEDDFILGELEHASTINNDDEEAGKVVFEAKTPTVFGECWRASETEPIFISITEYLANKACKNPECITIEYGGLDEDGNQSDEGGFVVFRQGETTDANSIDIMPVTAS